METKKEYDQHLVNFYAETFRAFALKNGLSSGRYHSNEAEEFANEALKQYGNMINKSIAFQLINHIQEKSKTLDDALENYPSMFWKTADGMETLKDLSHAAISKKVNHTVENLRNGQPDDNEAIENRIISVIQLAKKVSYKDMQLSQKMVENFQGEIKNATEYFARFPDLIKSGTDIEGFIENFNQTLLKVYEQDINKNENVTAYSAIQQVLHVSMREISTTLEYNQRHPKNKM